MKRTDKRIIWTNTHFHSLPFFIIFSTFPIIHPFKNELKLNSARICNPQFQKLPQKTWPETIAFGRQILLCTMHTPNSLCAPRNCVTPRKIFPETRITPPDRFVIRLRHAKIALWPCNLLAPMIFPFLSVNAPDKFRYLKAGAWGAARHRIYILPGCTLKVLLPLNFYSRDTNGSWRRPQLKDIVRVLVHVIVQDGGPAGRIMPPLFLFEVALCTRANTSHLLKTLALT